jgi:hypothetical protein
MTVQFFRRLVLLGAVNALTTNNNIVCEIRESIVINAS